MSNMKDYMMWLDDRGIATWSNEIGELIIPEGVNIYAPELVDEYKNEGWEPVELDDDDMIVDDEDDLIVDDGDEEEENSHGFHAISAYHGELMVSLIDRIVGAEEGDEEGVNMNMSMGVDELDELWMLGQQLKGEVVPDWIRDAETTEEEELPDDNGRQLSFWFSESTGMTADAQEYMHQQDAEGALI